MNKREVYQMLFIHEKVRHCTWGKGVYIYLSEEGKVCDGEDLIFSLNTAPLDGWEIYKPKRKIKKWLWACTHRADEATFITGYHANIEEVERSYRNEFNKVDIQKLIYTEKEVEE